MSLLDWTYQLPDTWEAKPLRSVVDYVVSNVDKISDDNETPIRLCNYTDVYNNETITPSLNFMNGTASVPELTKFRLAVGDVLITKDSESWDDVGVPAVVRETADDLVCGYHLALLRPFEQKMNGVFLFRCLQAKPVRTQLELAANGITRFGIPKSEIGKMRLPVPPLPQQHAIAKYLDRETTRLDALIATKERVLALLTERRQSLLARAVTRGLDPTVPVRDSGIPWLGNIPEHWSQCRLKHVLTAMDYGTSEPIGAKGRVAVLRMGDIRNGEIDYSNVGFLHKVDESLFLQPGDIVFNRTNSLDQIGKVALFRGNASYRVSFASYLVRLRSSRVVMPEFLSSLLNSSYPLAWGRAQALPAIGQANLNPNRYSYLSVALPPLAEQREIVRFVSESTGRLDVLRSEVLKTITLLKERRATLIAGAVTGQIDVERAA